MFKNDENVDNKIFIKNIEIGSEEKSLPFESVKNSSTFTFTPVYDKMGVHKNHKSAVQEHQRG